MLRLLRRATARRIKAFELGKQASVDKGMAWGVLVMATVAATAGGPAATEGGMDRSVDPTAGGCEAPTLSFHALQVGFQNLAFFFLVLVRVGSERAFVRTRTLGSVGQY